MVTMDRMHRNLFVDLGIEGRTHRTTMLQESFREVGVGMVSGGFSTTEGTVPENIIEAWMLSQEFAFRTGFNFITGVIFADTIRKDDLYTPYEGFGQVSITATSSTGTVYRTTSWDPPAATACRSPPAPTTLCFPVATFPCRSCAITSSLAAPMSCRMWMPPGLPACQHSFPQARSGSMGPPAMTRSPSEPRDRVRVTLNSATWDLPRRPADPHRGAWRRRHDMIDIGTALPSARLYGDDGLDTIYGGAGNDRIWGGLGDDTINGRLGRDLIYGEDGPTACSAAMAATTSMAAMGLTRSTAAPAVTGSAATPITTVSMARMAMTTSTAGPVPTPWSAELGTTPLVPGMPPPTRSSLAWYRHYLPRYGSGHPDDHRGVTRPTSAHPPADRSPPACVLRHRHQQAVAQFGIVLPHRIASENARLARPLLHRIGRLLQAPPAPR